MSDNEARRSWGKWAGNRISREKRKRESVLSYPHARSPPAKKSRHLIQKYDTATMRFFDHVESGY